MSDAIRTRKLSVWEPPDDGDSPTLTVDADALDGTIRLIECNPDSLVGVPHYKATIPAGAVPHWPDDLTGYALLATDKADDHYAEEVIADHDSHPWRVLRFARDVGGVIFPYNTQLNNP